MQNSTKSLVKLFNDKRNRTECDWYDGYEYALIKAIDINLYHEYFMSGKYMLQEVGRMLYLLTGSEW